VAERLYLAGVSPCVDGLVDQRGRLPLGIRVLAGPVPTLPPVLRGLPSLVFDESGLGGISHALWAANLVLEGPKERVGEVVSPPFNAPWVGGCFLHGSLSRRKKQGEEGDD
jgi:hypothetical protein